MRYPSLSSLALALSGHCYPWNGGLCSTIDWAEAGVYPFGRNLHSLQSLTGKLHLRNGWIRSEDYDTLQVLFWERSMRS